MPILKVRTAPRHDTMVDNILAVWSRSTPEERARGAAWYDDARGHAALVADIAGVPPIVGAAVIAVLSPQVEWSVNLREAYTLAVAYRDGTLPDANTFRAFQRNIDKAWGCLTMPDLWTEYVRGPKVSAFHRAIAGLPGGPVIDRHATRVATGYGYDSVSNGAYRLVQAAYEDAARIAGEDVHTLQAATWITCKRELASTIGQLVLGLSWPDRPSSFGG